MSSLSLTSKSLQCINMYMCIKTFIINLQTELPSSCPSAEYRTSDKQTELTAHNTEICLNSQHDTVKGTADMPCSP